MAKASQREQSKLEKQLLADYTKDWRRLQNQKQRRSGGTEARVLLNLAMVFGEHYVNQDGLNIRGRTATDEDRNKLFLVFNMIGRATWRKIGRLWSIDHKFKAVPNTLDPQAYDQADVVSKMILAINRKVREGQQNWNRLFWMLVGGVVIEHTPWVEQLGDESLPEFNEAGELIWIDQQTTQELTQSQVEAAVQGGATPERFAPKESIQTVGDVGSEIFTPLDFFIDSSVRTIRDLAGDQACYLAQIKTKGWVRDNFGEEKANQLTNGDLNIVKTRLVGDSGVTVSNLNLKDLIPAIQGSRMEGDPEMTIVLTRYQPRSDQNPKGKRCIFTPDGVLLDDGDIPYEDIPCKDIHWRPNAASFWSPDFVTDIVPGNKFLNKRMSQLGEAANAQVYEMILLGEGLKKTDIPTDYHGIVENGIDESGVPQAAVMQRGQLPAFFNDSIRLASEFIDSLGSADLLSQRKFPGQIRGPMAIPMLQEILDSEDGPVYTHLGEMMAEIHHARIQRVKAFYEPVRTMHYTGANNRDEVMVFHKSQVFRAGWDYEISVDRSSLLPELASLREARVRERLESPLAALYMNRRTGKIDISKIADDLKYNDTNREDRESQARKLSRQLIGHLWKGEQLDPALPMPFWDHDVMMDEFEAAMTTTEWLEASMPVKQGFIDFYNKCQGYLQKLHDAQNSAMENKMLQSAVAQATQQAAAKAAAAATDAALTQVDEQRDQAHQSGSGGDLVQQMSQMMNAQNPGRNIR